MDNLLEKCSSSNCSRDYYRNELTETGTGQKLCHDCMSDLRSRFLTQDSMSIQIQQVRIMVKKASPVVMRKTMELVESMKSAGIEFIPVPVLNDIDRKILYGIVEKRLDTIEEEVLNGE